MPDCNSLRKHCDVISADLKNVSGEIRMEN
jgi:hypothetical protein